MKLENIMNILTKPSQLIFLILVLAFSSCAPKAVVVPVRISSVRGMIPGTEVINKKISRADYKESLDNVKAFDRLRLVELMTRSQNEELPEHRLFDLMPGTPAVVLGLQNADILVAANDFVIHNPFKFKQYLILLQNEKTAEIEIRREEHPMIFKYEFVD